MKKIIFGVGISLVILISAGCQSSQDVNGNSRCLDIKGNTTTYDGEKIYHMKGDAYYDRTIAEQMFCTEKEAQDAGFRKSLR